MANVNAPFGFRPTMRTLTGGSGTAIPAHKLVGNGTALFIGDAVNQAASGTKPSRCITQAANAGTCVVLGVNLIYGALSTATDHIIVLASGAIFIAQLDGSSNNFTIAKSQYNANLVFGAGNANTKISGHALVESTIASTNTLDTHMRGIYQSPSNSAGQYAQVFISFNNLVDADQKAGV
jgi:hypothetical protein